MKFKGIIENFTDSSIGYESHIKIPNNIFIEMLKIATDKRIICNINNSLILHAAMIPKGTFHYILLNKENTKKHHLKLGDEVSVSVEKDTSKYGCEISEEMVEVLFSDPEGSDLFHLLTAGKQRTLIHIINRFKSSQLKIDRSFVILQHLKNNLGNLDYKKLNEDFKNFNKL